MARVRWWVGLALVLLAAGCQTPPPQPRGFEVRFLAETGSVTVQEKNAFDIHPRDELLSSGAVALPMDFRLNVAARALGGLRIQIVCGTSLYTFAPSAREGTCVIPIPPEGDIALTAKLFSQTGLVEEKQFLIPRFPNALEW
ncbi:MAG: hypothetical protein ACLQVA_00070 [Candidatus Brocadiia bacterium]